VYSSTGSWLIEVHNGANAAFALDVLTDKLDHETECILCKSTSKTKPGAKALHLDSWTPSQRELDRLDGRQIPQEVQKWQTWSPAPGGNKTVQQCRLKANWMKSGLSKQYLGEFMENILNIARQCGLEIWKAKCILGYISKKCNQLEEGGDSFPLLSTCKAVYGIMCPVLGSLF